MDDELRAMAQDERFERFTQGLARTIRSQERKRLRRVMLTLAAITALILSLLFHAKWQDHQLRTKLVDQCEGRNAILDEQRKLYSTMATIDTDEPRKHAAWVDILHGLPGNRDCQDFMR